MSDDRVYELAKHLTAAGVRAGRQGAENASTYAAKGILANPQAHIDALVEAGVLERLVISAGHDDTRGSYMDYGYRLVQPHVHEWRVSEILSDGTAYIECAGCKAPARVPNRLPIEVPE